MTGLVGSAPRTVRSRLEEAVRQLQALKTRRTAAAEHRWLIGRMHAIPDACGYFSETQRDQADEFDALLRRDGLMHGGAACGMARAAYFNRPDLRQYPMNGRC